MDLSDAQRFAREQLDKIPPTKYEVSPQQAYIDGGSPYGTLRMRSGVHIPNCRNCDEPCRSYSQAGSREVGISRMCEPCFDFTMIVPDDRNDIEAKWMSLVKYTKQEG